MESVSPLLSDRRELEGQGLARFMELRGRRIEEGCGALWHSVEAGLFVRLPHQLRTDPAPDDVRRLLWKIRATGIRYPSLQSAGLNCGLYVYAEKRYDISRLHRNFRAKVRKGMDSCEVVRMEPKDLLKPGLELNLQTMKRQGRSDPEFGSEASWTRLVGAIPQCNEIAAYGTLVDGRLAAYAITCKEDGWLHILHRMSGDEFLEYCPNHILDFTLTRQIETDPELKAVSMGYSALVAGTDGLHEYKTRLGYEYLPHKSVIRLHPALSGLMTSAAALRLVETARSFWPADQRIEKVAAVLQGARLAQGAPPAPERSHHESDNQALSA